MGNVERSRDRLAASLGRGDRLGERCCDLFPEAEECLANSNGVLKTFAVLAASRERTTRRDAKAAKKMERALLAFKLGFPFFEKGGDALFLIFGRKTNSKQIDLAA